MTAISESYREPAEQGQELPKMPPVAFDILRPNGKNGSHSPDSKNTTDGPVIYSSPHSGDYYPPDFVAGSRLSDLSLRMSEDSFVDRLFAAAPEQGAPLIRANYARVYVDTNREPYELDPSMFAERLPGHVNTTSTRVAGGLGTIPKIVSRGAEIYGGKLKMVEIEKRLRAVYFPYHQALKQLIKQTVNTFGGCLLIDCHSMPSQAGPMDRDNGAKRPDIILGDRYGVSCTTAITELALESIRSAGFTVVRNVPYAGGFTTANYGRPAHGVQAFQIELNRALYMDEARIEPLACFSEISERVTQIMRVFADLDPTILAATVSKGSS